MKLHSLIEVIMLGTLLGLLVGFILLSAIAHGETQHDAPTTRFYAADGKLLGSASTYGTTTKFYAPNGHLMGNTNDNSGRGRTTTTKIPGLPSR